MESFYHNGLRLFYRVTGEGRPLVFLHGMVTVQINSLAEKGNYGEACAYATILIVIVYAAVALMNLFIAHFGTSRKMKGE